MGIRDAFVPSWRKSATFSGSGLIIKVQPIISGTTTGRLQSGYSPSPQGTNTTAAPFSNRIDPTNGVQSLTGIMCLTVGPAAVGFYDKPYDQISTQERAQAPNHVFHPKGSSTDLNVFPGARVTCEDWGNGAITVVHLASPKNIRIWMNNGRLVIEST